MAELIHDPTLTISPNKTFFNLEKKSILHSHKAVLCHYKIFQDLPNFPTRVFSPRKPTTRGDTMKSLDDHQDTSSEATTSGSDQSSPEQQNQQNTSSEATTSGSSQSSPEQQSTKLASCQIPPPGQVRLPPEGKSPPVPPPELQGQPSANDPGSSSVRTKVGQVMATAACLLNPGRHKAKSQWL